MKKLTLLFLVIILSFSVKSQNLESILLASKDDANKLFNNYLEPAVQSLMYGMNNGWYHTAKTHKKLGFDISIGFSAAIAPSEKEFFQFIASDYSDFTSVVGNGKIPTVLGEDTQTTVNIIIPENSLEDPNGNPITHPQLSTSFQMPGGIGNDLPLNAAPTPTIQVGVGLPFSTDLKVRFVPKVGSDDIKGQLFGLGLQHNLMQYLGPLDKLPLNVSILGAFTNMTVEYDIQARLSSGANQKAEFKLQTYTIQAVASLDFPVISLYAGVGYNVGNATIKLLGDYDLTYNVDGTNVAYPFTLTDPINMDFDANGVRGTLGVRLNLGFFKLYGDYTLQEYNTISTGIAFSFR